MGYSLNSLQKGYRIGLIKGDTRSLNYSSFGLFRASPGAKLALSEPVCAFCTNSCFFLALLEPFCVCWRHFGFLEPGV